MKNTFFILTACCFILITADHICAQDSAFFKTDQFGLKIISDIDTYKKIVAIDSNKRMVKIECYVSPFVVTWNYATKNNFTHEILYHDPIALIRLPVAIALKKIEAELKQQNLGLIFYDAYRPYNATVKMWSIIPDERYAANPSKGSGHNRGIAVDVSLINLRTNTGIVMPTAFDNFTDSAHQDFIKLSDSVIHNRMILKNVMEKYGFIALPTEWWHFYWKDGNDFEILNIDFHSFENLEKCF